MIKVVLQIAVSLCDLRIESAMNISHHCMLSISIVAVASFPTLTQLISCARGAISKT